MRSIMECKILLCGTWPMIVVNGLYLPTLLFRLMLEPDSRGIYSNQRLHYITIASSQSQSSNCIINSTNSNGEPTKLTWTLFRGNWLTRKWWRKLLQTICVFIESAQSVEVDEIEVDEVKVIIRLIISLNRTKIVSKLHWSSLERFMERILDSQVNTSVFCPYGCPASKLTSIHIERR